MRRIVRAFARLIASTSLGVAAGATLPLPVLLSSLFVLSAIRAAMQRKRILERRLLPAATPRSRAA
jgi:hypothetical protein